ncbi:MAG TPA: hypothetical protein VF633_07360, partial [Brevundimonas sp.]
QKAQEAPAPATAPAAVAQTQAEIEAASQAAYDAEANTQPTDPVDAFIWRTDLCMHLSGEIGGDRSERDVQVQAQMEGLKCADVVADGRALKVANASNPAAVKNIEASLKAWTDYFGAP